MKYIANSNRQPLADHLLGVALRTGQLVDSFGFKVEIAEKIRSYCAIAAIFHDIGKTSKSFQDFISKKARGSSDDQPEADAEFSLNPKLRAKNAFKGPFHNEISWAIFSKYYRLQSNDADSCAGYGIYWHHPAFDMNGHRVFKSSDEILKAISDDVDSNDVHDLIAFLFEQISKKDLKLKLASEFRYEVDRVRGHRNETAPEYTTFDATTAALKRLVLAILIEADRWISKLTPDQLKNYIENDFQQKLPDQAAAHLELNAAEFTENKRSYEQHKLAKRLAEADISICSADPGSGKTSVALYWWASQRSNRPLMVALPRQNQVTGLFHTLNSDSRRIAKHTNFRLHGIFNGQIQHKNYESLDLADKENESLLTADINILVFDRLLSPCYERYQISEFLQMLRSHLVLDEFHEFSALHLMRPDLSEFLQLRSWFDSDQAPQTLLISGTPEIALLRHLGLGNKLTISRDSLEPFSARMIRLKFEDKPDEFLFENEIGPDTLFTFLRVRTAQQHLSQTIQLQRPGLLIHSQFTDSDRKKKLAIILSEFSRDGLSRLPIFSSKMLQSSFDISFKKAFIEVSLPFIDCQTLGRVNRFGHKEDSVALFFRKPNSSREFSDNRVGFRQIHDEWCEHLKSFIKENNEKPLPYRKIITELYDSFWTERRIQDMVALLARYEEEEYDYLRGWYPRRLAIDRKQNTKPSRTHSRYSFRGESLLGSAAVINDDLAIVRQLTDEDLINVSSKWEAAQLQKATERLAKPSLLKDLNHTDFFSFTKYTKKFGFKDETPLIYSHVAQKINKILNAELLTETGTLNQFYHSAFGLVALSLLPKNGLSACQRELDSLWGVDQTEAQQDSAGKLNQPGFRKFTQVNEKQHLVPLSRRVAMFYIEHAKLVRKGSDVRVFAAEMEQEYTVPIGSIGALLLGPGCSLTTEAARIMAARGCLIHFVGGGAVPLFLTSTQHRSPLPRIRQHRVVFDSIRRLNAGKILFQRRREFAMRLSHFGLPSFPETKHCESIEQLLSLEGQWAKAAYKSISNFFGVNWPGRQRLKENSKHPIVFLNHLSYSIADIVALHMGYDPNIGVLHGRTKGGGLCYDLADVVKPVLALVPSFTAIRDSLSLTEMKDNFIATVREQNIVDFLISVVSEIFGETKC